MLELRPNCEYCDKDLPPESTQARICSYECTFCKTCVDELLKNVCPNCGGGFATRPIRPSQAFKKGLGLQHQPASKIRVNTALSSSEILAFSDPIKNTKPEHR